MRYEAVAPATACIPRGAMIVETPVEAPTRRTESPSRGCADVF